MPIEKENNSLSNFNHDDPKYKFFCKQVHVKKVCYVVWSICVLILVQQLPCFVSFLHSRSPVVSMPVIIGFPLLVIALTSAIIGLLNNRKAYLWPILIILVTFIIIMFFLLIHGVYTILEDDYKSMMYMRLKCFPSSTAIMETIQLMLSFSPSLLALAYIQGVFGRCYKYLADLEEHIKQSGNHEEYRNAN